MRVVLLLLLASCTTFGKVTSLVGVTAGGTSTALFIHSHEGDGARTAAWSLAGLGFWAFVAALNYEVSYTPGSVSLSTGGDSGAGESAATEVGVESSAAAPPRAASARSPTLWSDRRELQLR